MSDYTIDVELAQDTDTDENGAWNRRLFIDSRKSQGESWLSIHDDDHDEELAVFLTPARAREIAARLTEWAAAQEPAHNQPRPFGDEETGFWSETVEDVEIVRELSPMPGWSVVVEGEPESFVAFFKDRSTADAFIATTKDTDGEPIFGNLDAVPLASLVLSGREQGSGIFWANGTDDRAVAALKTRFGYAPTLEAPASNVCEHGDHVAPDGKRFCSDGCARCEHESVGENGCDGICGRAAIEGAINR